MLVNAEVSPFLGVLGPISNFIWFNVRAVPHEPVLSCIRTCVLTISQIIPSLTTYNVEVCIKTTGHQSIRRVRMGRGCMVLGYGQ